MNLREQIEQEGYAITARLFSDPRLISVSRYLEDARRNRGRAGIRHLMSLPLICEIAGTSELVSLASAALSGRAVPFRATLFDKSPTANWLVAWHQDTALPLRERRPVEGWGPWSVKDGVTYAHAPAKALEKVVALRLHLDDSNSDNGPLRVLPGTHNRGVMTDAEIHEVSEKIQATDCLAPAGAVVLMKPLVVHASSKCVSAAPRRVLHVEYSMEHSFLDGLELAIT